MTATSDAAHVHRPRVEDDRLLRGLGRYADDGVAPGRAVAIFVRSPHAFARIVSIDAAAARKAPGVLAVLTAEDLRQAGVGTISRHAPMAGRGGAKLIDTHRPPFGEDRVLHVGHPVAAVIAETLAQAQDAAELIELNYDEMPPVIDVRAAVEPGAPQLWPDAQGNVALDWPGPLPDDGSNAREVDRIISQASQVARVGVLNQRIVVASMEPRGATASYDETTGAFTLRVCSQGVMPMREHVAAMMGLDRAQLRVVTEDVGGAFGMKSGNYPEYAAIMVAAKRLGRPVHWMSTRSEAFLTDYHARDTFTEAELALDLKGRFLALRIRHLAGMGAFMSGLGAHIQTNNFSRCFPGMYDIPRIDVGVRCVFTNTVPTAPYRGAGRPEANYVLERAVEEASRLTGIDRIELRRRNLIPVRAMPYATAVGTTYDSGDFEPILDKALKLADHAGFARRKADAKRRGVLLGLGISCFLEHSGGVPTEGAAVVFPGGDRLNVALAVQSTGQSHATVFARLAADRLHIPAAQVHLKQGDTALGVTGFASVASRSAQTVSHALVDVVDKVLAKGRTLASDFLEAAETDIAYRDGMFEVAGTDKRISLFEIAERAAEKTKRGDGNESLDTKTTVDTPQTFPNGVHIAEVEIDPETGDVRVLAYTAVDDCGTVLDHTIVAGQVHGALAQGLGQALFEQTIYDDSGQMLTGSFMDYAMPRADDMPEIREDLHPVRATTNPLGVKGVGEAGTTASLAAIMNAIADAVPGGAANHLDMPATRDKVWRACRVAAG